MKIAIIGAGFTGLSAGYQLIKDGHEITIFEKDNLPGGLAIGYQEKGWKWTLEKHYHHWFTNDKFVIDLANEIGYEVIIKRPKTSIFLQGKSYQLDSLKAFLTFSKLPVFDRLRMIVTLGLLRINPFWKPLEKVKATSILPYAMGKRAWNLIWNPQLLNKMGKYANDISLVWFWTRINKRTTSLAYPKGGFLAFANALVKVIEEKGGKIFFNTELLELIDDDTVKVITKNQKGKKEIQVFDKVIVTLPSFLFLKSAPQLPQSYKEKLVQLKSLGATNMILRLKKQFMQDGTYWLSICETPSPVLVVVEHTNLMDKKDYNNEHLVYVGNYTPTDSIMFTASDEKLLQIYDPLLKKIKPDYKKYLIDFKVFRAPFAQPIVPINYSKLLPPFITPLKHVFLANIEQVYPWDRGTNYAVELGEKIARIATK